jgi:predicted porin
LRIIFRRSTSAPWRTADFPEKRKGDASESGIIPDLVLAYYRQSQNSFVIGNGINPTGTCNTAVSAGCSERLDAMSFVADYRLAKHFDAYAGIMWSQARNGLINGFLLATPGVNKLSDYAPTVGMRCQF